MSQKHCCDLGFGRGNYDLTLDRGKLALPEQFKHSAPVATASVAQHGCPGSRLLMNQLGSNPSKANDDLIFLRDISGTAG
jgi:hypothetical protein